MLDAFLEDMAATPFVDGQNDCALCVADWVMLATGCADPAGRLRGRYATALGRERLLRRLGGLEAVMTECAARAALTETTSPERGDIGLVTMSGHPLAAICLGPHWAAKGAGLVVEPAVVIKAWRV